MSHGRRVRRLPPSADNATAGRTQVEEFGLQEFASRLQHRRIEMEYESQSALARELWGEIKAGRKAAKNRALISSWEGGKSYPSPANLALVAKVLGCTPEWLAPDLRGATVERQNPTVSITEIGGHSDEVMLRVAKLVPAAVAARVYAMLSGIGPTP